MQKIVKNTTFVGLLDLLAPHSCRGCGATGSILCNRCKNYIISHHTNLCPNCKTTKNSGKCKKCQHIPPTYIVGKRSELIGTLAHDYKYQSIRALARPLAEILDSTLPHFKGKVIIIPLPTISKHIRQRGLDHTYLIAKHLAHLRDYELQPLLQRSANTTQVGSNRHTRLAQATQAYTLTNHPHTDPHATYLLLDDVWTTGASMLAATDILHSTGIKKITISILALSE